MVKSTPPLCYDIVECVVEDTVLPASGSASIVITSVTGEDQATVTDELAVIQFPNFLSLLNL